MPNLKQHIKEIDEYPESIFVLHEKIGNYPWHSHHKGQLTYFDGSITILHTSGKDYYIPERHYLWIPPDTPYKYRTHTQTYLTRTIFISLDTFPENEFFNNIGVYPVGNLLLEVLTYCERWNGNVFPADEVAYSFLKSTVMLLPEISTHPLPVSLPVTTNERIVPVVEYLQSNLDQDLTLEGTGEMFGMSGRTLNRIFGSMLRISFFQYLKMARMVKAMELLLKTEMTVSEIAFEVGYGSISSFSNAFNEITGRRPSSFSKHN